MAKIRHGSITGKLTRLNLLVSAAALLLAFLGFFAYDLITYRDVLVHSISIQSQITGSNSVSALLFDDKESARKTLSAFDVVPEVVTACIYNAEGETFATYQRGANVSIPPTPQIQPGEIEYHWFERTSMKLVHTIKFQGQLVGYVYIESSLQPLIARMTHYLILVGVLGLLAMLGALFISRLAGGAIAEPVMRLAEIARRVSQDKNYSIRAVPGREEGELADLVKTFNEMLVQIEERDHGLQAAHDKLEERVAERTAELANANKELEAFSYSVSHDLRAPLRSIDGFSLALSEDYGDKLDAEAKGHIARVRAATVRMGTLIDDMLNLSRVSRAELHHEQVNLTKAASSIKESLQRQAPERQVEFVVQDGMESTGDTRLLRIALENLLSNAWKYTSKHSRARIEFGTMQSNGYEIYFVRDDGAGFDPAYAARLFGAFQRLHGVEEFPGTGVGLATVQRIIHRHGGRIWAESAVEKGATFYFTLNGN